MKPSTFSTASCGTIKYGKKALIDAITGAIVVASSSSSSSPHSRLTLAYQS